MIICKKCGHQNEAGATFCANCKSFLEFTGEAAPVPTNAGVKLLIVPSSLAVEAGGSGSYELSILNTGSVVDSFVLEIPDVPWMRVDPPEVNLFPGKSTKARIDARPPRDATVRAGQTRFTARATSRADPQISAEEMAVVAVSPFVDSSVRLLPSTSRGTRIGNHTVTVDNRSNQPITGTVSATDPEAVLAFDIKPETFTAPSGGSASIQVGVKPQAALAVGQEQPHRFQVRVDVQGSTPILLDGAMIQMGEIPLSQPRRRRRWPLVVLGVIAALVLLGGVGYAFLPGLLPHTSASPPAVALPAVQADAKSIVFPAQPIGTLSAPHTVSLTNTGKADLHITSVNVTGGHPIEYKVTANSCSPAAMAPQASCSMSVEFYPLSPSNDSYKTFLSIADDAPDSPQTITLSGESLSRAAAYAGTWVNDNPATNDIPKLEIAASGDTVTVHGYGACSPTFCDWASRSGKYSADPFVITFVFPNGAPTETLTIMLLNQEGTRLQVTDRYTTEVFHKT